jgi:hypothetical protein
MKKCKIIFVFFVLISGLLWGQLLPQNTGRTVFPSPNGFDEPGSPPVAQAGSNGMHAVEGVSPSSAAYPFVQVGREKMAEKKHPEAIEAYRTALRLEPLNSIIWGLYDDAVAENAAAKKRHELTAGTFEGSLKPIFSVGRVDSYIELNNLCLVGSIKNVSNLKRQNVLLRARLFDKNKRELAISEGMISNYDKALLPNESCNFEIIFKDYPKSVTDFKVEVKSWE